MLELYHHGSSVCAAKVRFALYEKQIGWSSHYVDILKGEQFAAAYLKINPKAVVPTLVDNGSVITESTVICEYLEDCWPEHPLMPDDPRRRADVRHWTKAVDEELHPACGAVTFMVSHRHTVAKLGPEELELFLNNTPAQSAFGDWKNQKRMYVEHGLQAPTARVKLELYYRYLIQMDTALQTSEWLVGDRFSLADVSLAPYVNRLAAMSLAGLWEGGRLPNLERWFKQIRSRDTFGPAFMDWMPSSLVAELAENGSKSWPEVARMLDLKP